MNKYLILVIYVIGFASPIWASTFTPACDTLILMDGRIIIAEIINHSKTGMTLDFCDEDKRIIVRPEKIQAINKYVNPIIEQRSNSLKEERKKRQAEKDKRAKQREYDKRLAEFNEKKQRQLLIQEKAAAKLLLPSQEELAATKKWRIGVELAVPIYIKLDAVKNNLEEQGFGDRYYSTGGFNRTKDQKNPKTTNFGDIGLSVNYKFNPKIDIGMAFNIRQLKIRAFNSFYGDTGATWFSSYSWIEGHHLSFKINTNQVKFKIEFSTADDLFAFYVGPTYNLNNYNRKSYQQSIGFWVGGSITRYAKKSKNRYFRSFIDYNYVKPIQIAEEFHSKTHIETLYESHFQGLSVPLSHIRLGLAWGVTF